MARQNDEVKTVAFDHGDRSAIEKQLKQHGQILIALPRACKARRISDGSIFIKCRCDKAYEQTEYVDGFWKSIGMGHTLSAYHFKGCDSEMSIRSKITKDGILLTRKKINRPDKIESTWEDNSIVIRVASRAHMVLKAKGIAKPGVEPEMKLRISYSEITKTADDYSPTMTKYANVLATIENGIICRDGKPLNLVNNDAVIKGIRDGVSA